MRPEHKQFKDGILQTLSAPSCLRAVNITHRQCNFKHPAEIRSIESLPTPVLAGCVRKLQGPCQTLPGGDVNCVSGLCLQGSSRVVYIYSCSLCLMLYTCTRSSIQNTSILLLNLVSIYHRSI
jgi:hypothetical protein